MLVKTYSAAVNGLDVTPVTIEVSLAYVLLGYNQAPVMFGPCLNGNGQHTLGRLQMAVETQLAHHHKLVEMRRVDLPIGRQDGDGQRQVKAASLLPKVGRRKIDRKVSTWKDVTIVLHGGSYAIASFAHRLIAEARKMIHNAFREAHLDGNGSNDRLTGKPKSTWWAMIEHIPLTVDFL